MNTDLRIDSVGYVPAPIGSRSKKREHVLIWEKHNKMVVPKGWVVHHINEDRTDNRIENLQAMTRGDHQRLHRKPKPQCVVCGRPQNARGLCNGHYTEWHRKTFGRGNKMSDKTKETK